MKYLSDEPISFLPGNEIWKSGLEYANEHTVFHGYPFYRIQKTLDNEYHMYMLDIEDPDSGKYWLIMRSKELRDEMNDIAQAFAKIILDKYFELNRPFIKGEKLIEALKPFPEFEDVKKMREE